MNNTDVFNELLLRYHENKLAHAFLLETNDSTRCYNDLLLFLKKLNCPFNYSDSCNESCNLCNLIDNGTLPSLITINPDGQFIKKNQILEVMDKFSTVPVFSKFNIYIINEAERFNSSSANTLLKFLEEPEDNIIGFFITNNKENVISTIRSRCQMYNCYYDYSIEESLNAEVLNEVKLYLNSIYKNDDDLLYNKTHMSSLYSDRSDWEIFFQTMLYYLKDCYISNRNDKIKMALEIDSKNIINILVLIEEILKYIKSNGNIDLILDKFVIEVRKYYE